MENPKKTEVIDKKVFGRIEYKLAHFPGDDTYAIYRNDMDQITGNGVQMIPELESFDNEVDAKKFFDGISSQSHFTV